MPNRASGGKVAISGKYDALLYYGDAIRLYVYCLLFRGFTRLNPAEAAHSKEFIRFGKKYFCEMITDSNRIAMRAKVTRRYSRFKSSITSATFSSRPARSGRIASNRALMRLYRPTMGICELKSRPLK